MTGLVQRLASPWLDLLLPLSLLGLAWQRSGDPAGMIWILALWCSLKLLGNLPGQPAYAVLIGVLAVSVGAVIHPVSVAAPTDLILVLLAFAAGLRQSPAQWPLALWIVLCTVVVSLPFVEFDRLNGNLDVIPWSALRDRLPQEALRIQKITINRSGYLYGLLALVGYGLFRWEARFWWSRGAALIGALSFVLAFGTGSRAALLFPILAVVVAELCWQRRRWVARHGRALAAAMLALCLMFNVALYAPSSPLANLNPSDAGRARVAQCFVLRSLRAGPDLFTGQGYDRVSDHCAGKVFLPGYTTGIPHAHNVFLQVLADQGLVSLVLLLIALGLTFQRLFQGLAGDQGPLCRLALACAVFILMSSLVESTLLKTSLQQVITGYILALAWMPGAALLKANVRTIAS